MLYDPIYHEHSIAYPPCACEMAIRAPIDRDHRSGHMV